MNNESSVYKNIEKFSSKIQEVLKYNKQVLDSFDDLVELYTNPSNLSDSDLRFYEYELHIMELRLEHESSEQNLSTLTREKTIRDFYSDMINAYSDGVEEGLRSTADTALQRIIESGKSKESAEKILEKLINIEVNEIISNFKEQLSRRYEFYVLVNDTIRNIQGIGEQK